MFKKFINETKKKWKILQLTVEIEVFEEKAGLFEILDEIIQSLTTISKAYYFELNGGLPKPSKFFLNKGLTKFLFVREYKTPTYLKLMCVMTQKNIDNSLKKLMDLIVAKLNERQIFALINYEAYEVKNYDKTVQSKWEKYMDKPKLTFKQEARESLEIMKDKRFDKRRIDNIMKTYDKAYEYKWFTNELECVTINKKGDKIVENDDIDEEALEEYKQYMKTVLKHLR